MSCRSICSLPLENMFARKYFAKAIWWLLDHEKERVDAWARTMMDWDFVSWESLAKRLQPRKASRIALRQLPLSKEQATFIRLGEKECFCS